MRGRSRAELIQANLVLTQRVETLERTCQDDVYELAKVIRAERDLALTNPERYAELYESAINGHMEAARIEGVRAAAAKRAAELIAACAAEIELEVRKEAEVAAQEALQRFHECEARTYREEVRSRLVPQLARTAIARTKLDIVRQEMTGNTQHKTDVASVETDDARRMRAEDLRINIKQRGILRLEKLWPGDRITLCFTEPKYGSEALTEGGRRRTELERRQLVCSLLLPEAGIVGVVKDSWYKDPRHENYALRAGRECALLALNPENDTTEPIVVKGAPAIVQPLEGHDVKHEALVVWWVKLDRFSILS
jgi:hypothetical protein